MNERDEVACFSSVEQNSGIGEAARSEPLAWWICLKRATFIWAFILLKTIPRITVIVTLMGLYYIPSRIITRDMLEAITVIMYKIVRNIFGSCTFWIAVSFGFVEVFSLQFALNAVKFSFIPVCSVAMVSIVSFVESPFVFNLVTNIFTATGIILGLYIVSRSKKPTWMTEEQEIYFSMTKDGTPMAVFKAVVSLFVFVVFLLQSVFPIYLRASFYTQLIFRFIVFPLCFTLSKWYQIHVIIHLCHSQFHRRMLFNKILNHYMHFVSRLYLSNLTTRGADSAEYILVNMTASLLEITTVCTHAYRLKIIHDIKQVTSKFYCALRPSSRNRVVSLRPLDELPDFGREIADERLERARYVKESMEFHCKQICDGISSEILSIFIAPLLMYFLYPIYPDTPFQTISTMGECIGQIGIQLVFEFIGDVISISHLLRQGYMEANIENTWRPFAGQVVVPFSVYCVVYIHRLVDVFV